MSHKGMSATYIHPWRRSNNALFVPICSLVAILAAVLGQPDRKRLVTVVIGIAAGWAAVAIASFHLRSAGRERGPAAMLGIALFVTLGGGWTSLYMLSGGPLLAIARIVMVGGVAASAILSVTISILGLRIVTPGATG